MNILILTKRQYMGKDTIEDRYGRFYEIPEGLARLGHRVKVFCLSYEPNVDGKVSWAAGAGDVMSEWYSYNAGPLMPLGFVRFAQKILDQSRSFHPDVIYAFSDSIYSVLGYAIARKIHCKCVLDFYDDFEDFAAMKIPGVYPLFRNAVRHADALTIFADTLKEKMVREYQPHGPVAVIEYAVSREIFFPMERLKCRQKLQFPQDATIISYTGAIHQSRGIQVIFDGFKILKKEFDNLHLVMAGPLDKGTKIPGDPHIHYLGLVPWREVPVVLCASDVSVICVKDDLSFPFKVSEIIVCRVPFVSTNRGSMTTYLADYPEILFEKDNLESFVSALRGQLKNPKIADLKPKDWTQLTKELETFLLRVNSLR